MKRRAFIQAAVAAIAGAAAANLMPAAVAQPAPPVRLTDVFPNGIYYSGYGSAPHGFAYHVSNESGSWKGIHR